MFLNLKAFCFEGQNMTFTVNMLLTCILLWWRRAPAVIRTVPEFASTIGRFVSRTSHLPTYVFLRRRSFTSRKLYACLGKSLCFSCTLWSSLYFWSSMYRFISPLITLIPQDSSVTLYAQVYWLCCVLYMTLFGLVPARPWFRSSMWILSVAGISKILCTSEVASATRTLVRMLDILRLGINFSWCIPFWRIENVWLILAITASQRRIRLLFDLYLFEARPRYFVFLWRHFCRFLKHSMADL